VRSYLSNIEECGVIKVEKVTRKRKRPTFSLMLYGKKNISKDDCQRVIYFISPTAAAEIQLWNGLWSLSWSKRNSSTSSSACFRQSIVIKQKLRP